jgi:hypothetical protein
LTDIGDERLVVQEAFGSRVTLRRLGEGATAFFEISGAEWARVQDPGGVDPGQAACVEALLDGETLLALRVFLGADCGPA